MPVEVPGFKGGDRTDIELPDVQRDLLKALKKAGKKVVFINYSGSAIGLVPETLLVKRFCRHGIRDRRVVQLSLMLFGESIIPVDACRSLSIRM